MGKVRLYELMKIYNVGFTTLVDYLIDKGESLPNPTPNSKVSDYYLEGLKGYFGNDVKVKNASDKVISRLHAIKETVSLPPDKRLVALSRIPVVDAEPYTPKTKRKTRADKQEEYNLKYLSAIREIEKIEIKVRNDATLLTPEINKKLQKLYKERRNLENATRRFSSFIRTNPGYEDVAKEVEIRRQGEIEAQRKLQEEAREERRRQRLLKRQQAAKEKAKAKTTTHVPKNTPQEIADDVPVIIKVKWEEVFFDDKRIEVSYKGKSYSVFCPESCTAYNSIILSFAARLSPIELRLYKSKATVLNTIAFDDIIKMLSFHNNLFHFDDNSGSHLIDIRRLSNVPKELLSSFFPIDKTDYLNYLQEKQDSEIRYLPVFESQRESPDGFLFTIKYDDGYLLVWESTDVRTHKSTYVFETTAEELIHLQQLLFDYIISNIAGKRQNLRNNRVKEFGGFNYTYIDHDFFPTWRNKFEEILRSKISTKCKNESIVVYEPKTPIISYKPTHNIVQNQINEILKDSGIYSEVVLESENVDIKAQTKNGKWHFFEIKTSKTRMCLREALGQILEYAHFKPIVMAEKLFIVGLYRMSDVEKQYIRLLRNLYNIPVWYMWFDIETQVLHQPSDS